MTKRAGRSVENDPGVQGLLNSAAKAVCFVAKAWDKQIELAMGITQAENIEAIRSSVAATLAADKECIVDCEHFFSMVTNPMPTMPSNAQKPLMTRARAGSCCATPMGARCPMRLRRSSPM